MGGPDSKRFTATSEMIDTDGYRANVGIILCNSAGQVMWARRIGQDAWQFPQGGIAPDENWLRYKLPKRLMRRSEPRCIGQKQLWYLLQLDSSEDSFDLSVSGNPEFDHWEWVDYWYPVENVVFFKRRVYQCALAQLESRLPSSSTQPSD
jgi:putative (di)nucleoside polyphosphate hydrolase